MAQPAFHAQFFVAPDGVVTPKAPPVPRAHRFRLYQASDKCCEKCRRPVKFGGVTVSPFETLASGHIDHRLPRCRGGQNDDSNLRLLCMSCNCSAGSKGVG